MMCNVNMLKVLVNTLIDNSGADAPINILINEKLYDIENFYYDDDICEYVMELGGGYTPENVRGHNE